jgi:hypothetical protein
MELFISVSSTTAEEEQYRREHMPKPGKSYKLSVLKGSGKGYWADLGIVHIASVVNGIINYIREGAGDDARMQHVRAETIPSQTVFS